MIGVTFAHPSESRDFLSLLGGRHREVKVLHTGVGATVCRERIGPLLDSQSFTCLLSSGFAGGTDASLGTGDLFLAENFSDAHLLALAREAVIARVGKLVSVERVIEDATERARLAREHGAAAVDMETEWIAQACAAREIPLLSLRAISDTAAAPFPAPARVLFELEKQGTPSARLAGYLLFHPPAILRLARFARRIAAARAELAVALKEVIDRLA
jgi:purine-nucleoside phosphorylase